MGESLRDRLCHELGLELPHGDEATLWLAPPEGGAAGGGPERAARSHKMVKLHKGFQAEDAYSRALRWLAGFSKKQVVPTIDPKLPAFIRSLTDPYKIGGPYKMYTSWEIVECARKTMLCGFFMFFGRGSITQLVLGLCTCVLFILLYNNLEPFDVGWNNLLQELCQLVIFVTLLAALVLEINHQDEAFEKRELIRDNEIGAILVALSVATIVLGFCMMLWEARWAVNVPKPHKQVLNLESLWNVIVDGVLRSIGRCCGRDWRRANVLDDDAERQPGESSASAEECSNSSKERRASKDTTRRASTAERAVGVNSIRMMCEGAAPPRRNILVTGPEYAAGELSAQGAGRRASASSSPGQRMSVRTSQRGAASGETRRMSASVAAAQRKKSVVLPDAPPLPAPSNRTRVNPVVRAADQSRGHSKSPAETTAALAPGDDDDAAMMYV